MNWTVVENETKSSALIRVVGVGGAGGNAVNHMVESGIEGVQMICANTDEQALDTNLAELKITLGTGISNGLGAGGKPEVGRDAALDDLERIKKDGFNRDQMAYLPFQHPLHYLEALGEYQFFLQYLFVGSLNNLLLHLLLIVYYHHQLILL